MAHAVDPTGAGYDLNLLENCDDPNRTGPGPGGEGLPRMGAALAAGLVSRGHVDVAVRCLARVPEHLANRVDEDGVTGRTRIDVFLTTRSRQFCPTTTQRLATELLECLDPGGRDRFDPLAHKRRTLSLVTDSTGMTTIHGLLDPASAALVRAALAHYGSLTSLLIDPDGPQQGQSRIPLRDDRSPGQRRADSLRAMCEAALRAHYPTLSEGGPGTQPAAPLVKVVITATPEQAAAARRATPGPLDHDGTPLWPPGWVDDWATHPRTGKAHRVVGRRAINQRGKDAMSGVRSPAPGLAHEAESGDPISPATFGRLLCEADLQTVVLGHDRAVLDLGRTRRLASPSQRTALVARDRGCVAPGCGMPPSACESHHANWWRDGGGTDITNLALVCGRHHTVIHTGE